MTLLPAAPAGPPRSGDVPERPESRWREGPVRYIITPDEDREFKQLATDEDRARFIERFWGRRDPDRRTLINEYRYEFWKRVATANRFFAESSKPGWKTDMGRYYILLGPPDDRDTSREMPMGLGRLGIRGAIEWRYSRAPLPRVGAGLRLVFTRDATGEYRAESNPAVVEEVLYGSPATIAPDLTSLGLSLPQFPLRMSELHLMMDLGRLEEIPSENDLLTAIVTAEEYLGVIPFDARYDFFAGVRGETVVAITLGLDTGRDGAPRGDRDRDLLIVGRVDPATPPESSGSSATVPRFLHERDFSPSGRRADPLSQGPEVYQALASLPPGRYQATFAAFDPVARKTGSHTDMVEVPAFTQDDLALSSLCLSASIEPVGRHPGPPGPYVMGHFKVMPRLSADYRNGDTFAVYFQVYSARTDPVTAAADLEIEYQFFIVHGGSDVAIGRPIRFESLGNSAQGWSFPLRDWPTGEFKLQVTVTDALSGQVASRDVPFRIR